MQNFFSSIGIDLTGDHIYEFEPQMLDWWDAECPTAIEFEVMQDDQHDTHISIVFCRDSEGAQERISVFMGVLEKGEIKEGAFIAKAVFEKLDCGLELPLLEEYNAYRTHSTAEALQILQAFARLLRLTEPVYVFSLSDTDDAIEVGDTLPHFLAMLTATKPVISRETIEETLQTALHIEGETYIKELQEDLADATAINFKEEFGISDADWALIYEVAQQKA